MLFLSNMSLYELKQRKVLLKTLRPQMWDNKVKMHSLDIAILKVESEIQNILNSEWIRYYGNPLIK